MIGWLSGIIVSKLDRTLTINTNGVGYEVEVNISGIDSAIEVNQKIQLYIHFVVREDAQSLYGFASIEERNLFRELIKINGVGPKAGMSIMCNLTLKELSMSVYGQDHSSILKVPGVGKKTAQRIIIDLKDRIPKFEFDDDRVAEKSQVDSFKDKGIVINEAHNALVSLGFKSYEIKPLLVKIYNEQMGVEDLIKQALKFF